MEGIIFGVFVLLIVSAIFQLSGPKKCSKKKSSCGMSRSECGHMMHPHPHTHTHTSSIFDVEQDPRSRGLVPQQKQPDHIANLWKCDHSQPKHANTVCSERDARFTYGVTMRRPVVNQNVGDVSNMHKISRFGGVPGGL
jgi:hypothetical protein